MPGMIPGTCFAHRHSVACAESELLCPVFLNVEMAIGFRHSINGVICAGTA